jgi:hypothetical protein
VPIIFRNIPQGSLGGHIEVGTGDSKFVAFCLDSPRLVNVVTEAGFVLMALVFTNIATGCQYIRFCVQCLFLDLDGMAVVTEIRNVMKLE